MTCIDLRETIAVRLLMGLALLALIAGLVKPAAAQTAPATTAEPSAAAAPAASLQFSISSTTRSGRRTYAPGRWGELHLILENPGTDPRDVLCSSYFGEHSELQFGRQIWSPAHSRLRIAHPALIPSSDGEQPDKGVVNSLVIERQNGEEVLVKNESGQLRHDRTLQLTPTLRNTGVIGGWNNADSMPQDVLDAVAACRISQGLTKKVSVLTEDFLPADEAALGNFDHLVLAENRLCDDFAALAAVRRWLFAGGRLWILLDRTEQRLLEQLFGDDFQGEVVDRVSLTSVRIDKPPTLQSPDGEAGETIEYDVPVDFARVLVSGVRVVHTVEGWPAAMTRSYGQGRVFMTTLGPRAWIKPAPSQQQGSSTPPDMVSEFIPGPPLQDLAAYVLAKPDAELLPPVALEPIAQEYVSYKVPSWWLMIGAMAAFLAALFAAGVWLWRSERREHFSWTGSLLALAFGIAFMSIGTANRNSVPPAVSSVQLAQSVTGTDDVRTHGTMAVYRAEPSDAPIQASLGGTLWPQLAESEAVTRRLVNIDLASYRWDGLTQPAGLRRYSGETSGTYSARPAAPATIDSRGLVGRYTGHSAAASDAVLATRSGRLGVRWGNDGAWTAAAESVLEPGQYLEATLLGDVQDRRRRLLQQLFESPAWRDGFDRPQLLVWLNDWRNGFQFGEDLQHQGETLLCVPVNLVRPQVGTEMLIPAPLIRFKTTRPPDGSPVSVLWDEARREWQERSSLTTTWLSFQLPRELLPVRTTGARLSINVSGPMRRLEVLGVRDGGIVSLQEVNNPVGSIVLTFDDPDVLAVTDAGDLTLGISAGVPADVPVVTENKVSAGATANYWRIESLALQVWATASPPPEPK